jgi:hypothetical protein
MVAFPDRNLMELWFDCVRRQFGAFTKNRLHEDRIRVRQRKQRTYLQMSLLPPAHDRIDDGFFPEHDSTGRDTQTAIFCLAHRHRCSRVSKKK